MGACRTPHEQSQKEEEEAHLREREQPIRGSEAALWSSRQNGSSLLQDETYYILGESTLEFAHARALNYFVSQGFMI